MLNEPHANVVRVTIYIPDKDRYAADIDAGSWIAAACRMFSEMAGGATVIPQARGVWLEGDLLITEEVHIIYSLIPADTFPYKAQAIYDFAKRFAKEGNQATVGVEVDSKFYFISAK